jgi:hypothetical protein
VNRRAPDSGARAARDPVHAWGALALAWLATFPGCAAPAGPPPIRAGMTCDACGMTVADLRFACERRTDRGWRRYDSIECLLREAGSTPAASAYLTDYDSRTLHAAESSWVVRGSFPSPMGGGFAAFYKRAAAESVAARTNGRVGPLAGFAAPGSVP